MSQTAQGRVLPFMNRVSRLPWWLLLLLILGVLFAWHTATNRTYSDIFRSLWSGVGVTIAVTLVAYALAVILGLLLAFARLSKNPILFHLSTLFVEVIRGLPVLVLLLYVAFVLTPVAVNAISGLGKSMFYSYYIPNMKRALTMPMEFVAIGLDRTDNPILMLVSNLGAPLARFTIRDVTNSARAIAALVMAYSAFISEIFRAGISSIDRGQMEAARSLGMTYWQAMRHVILPQAIRNVLPPLGNDFIAMLKDSSLVSVLGVRDLNGEATLYIASSFDQFNTYNVMAYMYLVMTLVLSLIVQFVERTVTRDRRPSS